MRTYDFLAPPVSIDHRFRIAYSTSSRRPIGSTDESYPPYNIERLAEDRYQITLAVAGFSPQEISITAEQNVVTIEGGKRRTAKRPSARVPLQGYLDPAFQAAIQPWQTMFR